MQILYSYLTYCPLLRKNMPVPFSERKIFFIIYSIHINLQPFTEKIPCRVRFCFTRDITFAMFWANRANINAFSLAANATLFHLICILFIFKLMI